MRLVFRAAAALMAVLALAGVPAGKTWAGSASAAQPAPGASQERRLLGPYQGDIGRPYFLPQATRAQVHECAETWQKMKLSGAADNLTWRIFATGCLNAARKSAAAAPGAVK